MFDLSQGILPAPLNQYFTDAESIHIHKTRHCRNLRKPNFKLRVSSNSILWKGPEIWNNLPDHMRTTPTRIAYKKKIKLFLISVYTST